MTTVEERREVARRLRWPFDVIGEGRYVALNGTLFGMQLRAGDEGTLRAGIARLADLIEPNCDRDALLRLADELEEDACWEVQTQGDTSGAWRLKDACDRIREALGVEHAES